MKQNMAELLYERDQSLLLSHPEIFEFQDVIEIKNKITIFL